MTNYLSVTEKGRELLHGSKPNRRTRYGKNSNSDNRWYDSYNPFYDYIELPKGTIRQLIGRDITFQDGPICLKTNKIY